MSITIARITVVHNNCWILDTWNHFYGFYFITAKKGTLSEIIIFLYLISFLMYTHFPFVRNDAKEIINK